MLEKILEELLKQKYALSDEISLLKKEQEKLEYAIKQSHISHHITSLQYEAYLDQSKEYALSTKQWRLVEVTKSQRWEGVTKESPDGMGSRSVGGGYIPSYFVFQSDSGDELRIIASSVLPGERKKMEKWGKHSQYLTFNFLSLEDFITEENKTRELTRKYEELKILWQTPQFKALCEEQLRKEQSLAEVNRRLLDIRLQIQDRDKDKVIALDKEMQEFVKPYRGKKASLFAGCAALGGELSLKIHYSSEYPKRFDWADKDIAVREWKRLEGLMPRLKNIKQ